MPLVVEWNAGGTATLDEIDDDKVLLTSSRAFPPGSRPEGKVTLEAKPATFCMKVHGARRQDDGSYRVHGRVLNASRVVRDRLKEAVSAPNGGKTSSS